MPGLDEADTSRRSTSSQDALEGLREARGLLIRPLAPALDACVPYLETAIRHLKDLENRLRGSARQGDEPRQIRGEVEAIAREVRVLNALMENSGRFYAGLGQLLAVASQNATYTAQGLVETEARRSKLRVAG